MYTLRTEEIKIVTNLKPDKIGVWGKREDNIGGKR